MCFSFPLISVALNVIIGLLVGLTLTNCSHAYALFTDTFFFWSHRRLNDLHARSLMGAGKSMKVSFLALFQLSLPDPDVGWDLESIHVEKQLRKYHEQY